MFCPNCGNQVPDDAAFCGACGQKIAQPASQRGGVQPEEHKKDAVQRPQQEDTQLQQESAPPQKQGGSRKKIIITVVAIAVVIIIVAVAIFLLTESSKKDQWQEQYDLGKQYLTEENYEQAVVAFTAAIEIDDQETDAYMGRAEAYTALGEEDDLDAALRDYQVVMELEPTRVEAYTGSADIYIDQGDYDSAGDVLDDGEEQNPDNEDIENKRKDLDDRILTERYQAYYDKLMELQETYGTAALKSDESYYTEEYALITYFWTGLFFAKLLDFNGDGEEELVTAVYDPDADTDSYDYDGYLISVWAFEDGEVQEVYQQDEMYSFSSGAMDSGCLIVEREEIWYMVTGYVSGDGMMDDCYYAYDAENMTFSIAKRFEAWVDTDGGFRIDGEDVEEEEVYETWSTWNGELSEELEYYFLWEWDTWLDETDATDETAGDVSEELEETLETLRSFLGIEEEDTASDETLITDTAALYQAYSDQLLETQETYGTSDRNTDLTDGYGDLWLEGLCFAQLLDLNDDGEEELILAYYDPDRSNETVTYEDTAVGTGGYVIEVWANQDGILTQVYSGYPAVRAEYIHCSIAEVDGIMYLVSGTQGNGEGGIFELYQYTGEEMTLSKTVVAWSGEYSIDGTQVSAEEAYEAADEIQMAASEYGLCTFLYGTDPDDVTMADDTLEGTLEDLQSYE